MQHKELMLHDDSCLGWIRCVFLKLNSSAVMS